MQAAAARQPSASFPSRPTPTPNFARLFGPSLSGRPRYPLHLYEERMHCPSFGLLVRGSVPASRRPGGLTLLAGMHAPHASFSRMWIV
jgi:hypothetical protein